MLLLVAWSFVTPLGEAPDEHGHVDLVFHLATGAPYPEWDERRVGTAVLVTRLTNMADSGLRPERWLTPDSAAARGRRPSFDDAGGDRESDLPNQIAQHPWPYYEASSWALRLERRLLPGATAIDREWLLLRWLNLLMIAPLVLLAWLAARRLGADDSTALAAAVVPLAVPQLAHIGSAVNNDNLLTLLCGILAVLLAGVLRGDLRRSTALAVGVVAGLALLTKAFALVLPLWILAAYGVPALRNRARIRDSAVSVVVASATAAVVGGWWWVRQLIEDGELNPSLSDRLFSITPPGFEPDLAWYAPRFAWWMLRRFWGDFGYLDVPMPVVVVVAASVVVCVAIVAVLLPRPWPGTLELAAFASIFLLLLGAAAVEAYGLYSTSGRTPFIQGRYLFAAIVPFSVVVGVGLGRLLGRWAPVVLLAGAVAMQAEALYLAVDAWWGEPEASLGRSLDALIAWSPLPPAAVWAVAALVPAAAAASAFQLWRLSVRS